MSYDVGLAVATDLGDIADRGWNYTSNGAPMWRKAGADLRDFHGRTAAECLPLLEAAIAAMCADAAAFRELDPPNGWGSFDTLLPALVDLAAQFRAHPDALVQVSH